MNTKLQNISFIIFTYNSEDLISRTLTHIIDAIIFHPIENEIIVVDNNSVDSTLKLVKLFSKENSIDIKIVENKKQGLSYSRIEGIKVACKEFVCFIDDDNFISEDWIKTLAKIISEHNPDIIGCRTIGISDAPFPDWWEKYQNYYACGKRFDYDGFLRNPLDKVWGAGLTVKRKFVKPALLRMDLLCTGRVGTKQMSGEDVEMIYRMKLLGASIYNSNELFLEHFMRSGRLTKNHLQKTRTGNALGAINLDVYKYLLTNKKRYKLFNLAVLIFVGAIPLSLKYKVNYFKYAILRFRSLKERKKLQEKISDLFQNNLDL